MKIIKRISVHYLALRNTVTIEYNVITKKLQNSIELYKNKRVHKA